MSDKPFKPWHIPLTDEQKAEAIARIRERHEQMLAMGPELWAAQGRNARYRLHAKSSSDTDGD